MIIPYVNSQNDGKLSTFSNQHYHSSMSTEGPDKFQRGVVLVAHFPQISLWFRVSFVLIPNNIIRL